MASTLQLQATQYANAWKTNRWDDVLRPPVVAAAPRVYVDAVAFWDRDDMKREFPLIREIAMYYLSVPLSTACVQRSFLLLHIMDDDTRMAMGDALLENELFVRCHRQALEEKLAFLITELRELQRITQS